MPGLITTRDEAIAFLDARIGSGVQPGLDRISGVLDLMGDPHLDVAVVHVAGTNGKTTTVRLVDDLIRGHGVRTGSFTSPHLERIEERFTIDGYPLGGDQFARVVADVAPFVEIFEERNGTSVTYFEVTAAMAFAAFAEHAVNAAVVEVGLGGRLDATNVVPADVSVVTGIGIDHTAYLGDTIAAIAAEKAAILKEAGILVTGPLPAAAEGPVTARVAETGSTWLRSGEHFGAADARKAVGGWYADIRGLEATYREVLLRLHGRHQVDNFATAVAATEALFGRALDPDVVAEVAAAATSPGRLEVVGRKPLVILDGAHNDQGLEALGTALAEEFPETHRILVVGFRGDRRPRPLLEHLRGLVGEVIVTEASDDFALPADQVAVAAVEAFGEDVPVEVVTPPAQAVTEALDRATEEDIVVVTGSLYVVGEARRRFVEGTKY